MRAVRFEALLLFSAMRCAWAQQDAPLFPLRDDGAYVSQQQVNDETYCEYLRFYSNRTVIRVTSECGPEAVQSIKGWFSARRAGPGVVGVSRGQVVRRSNRIVFTAVSKEGAVRFEGTVLENRLVLRTHSYINGRDDQGRYDFIRW